MNKLIIFFFILISYFAHANDNDVNIHDQSFNSVKKSKSCFDMQLKRTKLISQYEVDYWLNQKDYDQIIDKIKSKLKYEIPKKFIYDKWQDEVVFKLPLISDHTNSHLIFVVSHDKNLNLRLANLRTKHTYFDEYILDSLLNEQSFKYDNKKYNFFIIKNLSGIDKTLSHLYLFFNELDVSKNNPKNLKINVHFFEHEDTYGILEIDDFKFNYISKNEVINNKYKRQEMIVGIVDCLDTLTIDKMNKVEFESALLTDFNNRLNVKPNVSFNFLYDYYEYFILIFFIILNTTRRFNPSNRDLLILLIISLITFSDSFIWLLFIYFISVFINRNIWVKKDDS